MSTETTTPKKAPVKKSNKKAAEKASEATTPFDHEAFIAAAAAGEDTDSFNEDELVTYSKGLNELVNAGKPMPSRVAAAVKSNTVGSYLLFAGQAALVGAVGYLGVKELGRGKESPEEAPVTDVLEDI